MVVIYKMVPMKETTAVVANKLHRQLLNVAQTVFLKFLDSASPNDTKLMKITDTIE